VFLLLALATAHPAAATEWFVAPGGSGSGTAKAPFGRIQDALAAARAGDVVTVAAGTYTETLRSVRAGTASARITVRAADAGRRPVVTAAGRVLTVQHAYLTFDGLVLDGKYGAGDIVRLDSSATGTSLLHCEVRRSSKDGIDMGAPADVLIDGCEIHHLLNASGGRTDAHGIVAGAVRRLTIRNTEIHTFSGDGFQADPGRKAPGWDQVTIEHSRIWLAPLTEAANGFARGVVPGENAIDTKAAGGLSRARLTISDTTAYGFRGGLINNMAAFNIKENVDVTIDRTTVYDSEIAFRLRGGASGAWVRISNAVVYDVATAFRYEDNIQNLRIWNSTIGRNVNRAFQNASSAKSVLDVRNLLVLAGSLPGEAAGGPNLAVAANAFVDAAKHDYRLAAGTRAIDSGVTIKDVRTDRQGTSRPQGPGYDIGAFERGATTGGGATGGGDEAGGGTGTGDVVLAASSAPTIVGNWAIVADPGASTGLCAASTDLGAATVKRAAAKPDDYFELRFDAEAGRPYHLWMRMRAERDRKANDAVFVQFSDSLDGSGAAAYRIGTTSGAPVSLAECGTCALSGWGWEDNGYGRDVLGPAIYFARTGTHTVRVQIRQDGVAVDQILLSPARYLTSSPGRLTNDTTVLDPAGAH
jgi:hypothetical protein